MAEGWPADTGPLHTLTKLGNLPAGEQPSWLNPDRATRENSTYQSCVRRGLVPNEIVDLAALIVEGYNVCVYPRGHWTHIIIKQRTKETGP